MSRKCFSEYELHAYIDGELDPGLRQCILAAMETDCDLAVRVHELQRTKEWVRAAFENVKSPATKSRNITTLAR